MNMIWFLIWLFIFMPAAVNWGGGWGFILSAVVLMFALVSTEGTEHK